MNQRVGASSSRDLLNFWGTRALVLMAASGCSDTVDAPVAPPTLAVAASTVTVPPRNADTRMFRWSDAPDSALWAEAARGDTLFAVGLKSPGAERGYFKGQRLIAATDWINSRQALSAASGVRLVWIDSLLPLVRIKISDPAMLARVRRLPFIDYIEPAYVSNIEFGLTPI